MVCSGECPDEGETSAISHLKLDSEEVVAIVNCRKMTCLSFLLFVLHATCILLSKLQDVGQCFLMCKVFVA